MSNENLKWCHYNLDALKVYPYESVKDQLEIGALSLYVANSKGEIKIAGHADSNKLSPDEWGRYRLVADAELLISVTPEQVQELRGGGGKGWRNLDTRLRKKKKN